MGFILTSLYILLIFGLCEGNELKDNRLTKTKACNEYPGYTFDARSKVCYKVKSQFYKSHRKAVKGCEAEFGGYLLLVDNKKIFNLARKITEREENMPFAWLDGETRQVQNRTVWLSSDKKELTYFKWVEGEPEKGDRFLGFRGKGMVALKNNSPISITAICEIRPRPTS